MTHSFQSLVADGRKKNAPYLKKKIYKKVFENLNKMEAMINQWKYNTEWTTVRPREKSARVTVDFVWSCGPILFAE